jgi:ATP-dependent DNA helicase RecG
MAAAISRNRRKGVPALSREKVRSKMRRKCVEKCVEKSEETLELLFEDKFASASSIAEKLSISLRSAQKYLAKLKDIGVIERIGANKGGCWKIIYHDNDRNR